MCNINYQKVHSFGFHFIVACFVGLVMFLGSIDTANAQNQSITMKIPVNCNGYSPTWSYTFASINDAVKDTMPLEWWTPANLGVNPIPYTTLQAASIQIRTRLYANRIANPPLEPGVHFYTHNINTRIGQSPSSWPLCNATMDTIVGIGNTYGNAADYQSNNATNATTGNYIVQIDGSTPALVGFYPPIQQESATCTEQSDDWRFCSISSLGRDINRSGNRFARRLNTSPANVIEFQAEAFYNRQQRNGFYWFCRTSIAGWTGKCYMSSEPNNQFGYPSSVSYWTQSPQLSYHVAFPISDGNTKWYIWVRGRGCSVNDDTVHAGMYAQQTVSAQDMGNWTCAFTWKRSTYTAPNYKSYVTPNYNTTNSSFHDINIWMREDGFIFDKIVITSNDSYVP